MVDFDQLKALGVQILGVSVDGSFSQQTFADSLGLPFPLLSDSGARVTQMYAVEKFVPAGADLTPVMQPGMGMRLKKDRIIASQAFFLVDKQGILRGRWLPGREPMSSKNIAFWVESGALASYGPDYHASGRQAARLVAKILKGAEPAEIPVEVNPQIEFAINRKVATAMKLTIAPDVWFKADRVIR